MSLENPTGPKIEDAKAPPRVPNILELNNLEKEIKQREERITKVKGELLDLKNELLGLGGKTTENKEKINALERDISVREVGLKAAEAELAAQKVLFEEKKSLHLQDLYSPES